MVSTEHSVERTVTRQRPLLPPWLSLSNVLTIITMSLGGLWTVSALNTAQAVQGSQIQQIKEAMSQEREEVRKELQELRTDVKELLRRSYNSR